ALQDLAETIRAEHRKEGIDGAIGVPEPVVRHHPAFVHLSIIRAVVMDLPLRVDLVELAGKELRSVETGDEGAPLVFASAFDGESPERCVPNFGALFAERLEGEAADLSRQVQLRLLPTDEGCCDPRLHAAITRRELDVRPGALALPLLLARGDV